MSQAKPKNRKVIRKLITTARDRCCGSLDEFGIKTATKVTAMQLDRDVVVLEHPGGVLIVRLADAHCGPWGVGAFGLCVHGRNVYRWLHKRGKLTSANLDEIHDMTIEHETEREHAAEKSLLDVLAKRYGYTLTKNKK